MKKDDTNQVGVKRQVFTRLTASLVAAIVMLQPGCAAIPQEPAVPETGYQTNLGKVAVAAAFQVPEIKLEGFVRGKGEGAVKGAASTFGGCLQTLGESGCSGDLCGAVVLLGLVVCAVVTPVGALVGAVASPSAKEVEAHKGNLSAALEARMIQETLRDKVAASAAENGGQLVILPSVTVEGYAQPVDYRTLAQEGINTVLEVGMTKISTSGSGINPPLVLDMEARVRLIRTSDSEIFSAHYVFSGGKMRLSEWSENQGEKFVRAINAGFETLGSHIYDNVFLLYPFPSRKAQEYGPKSLFHHSFGLAPVYPLVKGGVLAEDGFLTDNYTKVDSLQPTLRWQSFPREPDMWYATAEMKRVKNVRYDLVIAREYNWAPSEVVYRRQGLPSNEQKIEIPLLPGTRYFWSVRARFDLDGRERVTEWASLSGQDGQLVTAPSLNAYRFRTP